MDQERRETRRQSGALVTTAVNSLVCISRLLAFCSSVDEWIGLATLLGGLPTAAEVAVEAVILKLWKG